MARGRVWQGIRDWFRPVDRAPQSNASREETLPSQEASDSSPSRAATQHPGRENARVFDRHATRARIDAEGGAEVIPFPGRHAAEAVLDPADLGSGQEAELLEFLAADVDPVPADPAFRERLREELWEMVVSEGRRMPGDGKDL
ncbi:MAG: hypothetical protein NXI30_24330 [bacterium]|nr:hypothetical protein [bacterium]